MKFQTKLLLVMLLLIGAVTLSILLATQASVKKAYTNLYQERFDSEIGRVVEIQQSQTANLAEACEAVAARPLVVETLRSPPTVPALREIAEALPQAQHPAPGSNRRPGGENRPSGGVLSRLQRVGESSEVIAFLADREGKLYPLGNSMAATRSPRRQRTSWVDGLAQRAAEAEAEGAQVGYLIASRPPGKGEEPEPHPRQIIAAPVVDPANGEVIGGFLLGTPAPTGERVGARGRTGQGQGAGGGMGPMRSGNANENSRFAGLYLDGSFFGDEGKTGITDEARSALANAISADLENAKMDGGEFVATYDGEPYRVLYCALNPGSSLPLAYHVNGYSLADLNSELRALRTKAAAIGAGVLALAAIGSILLSRGLGGPLRTLSAATGKIAEGDLEVRVPAHGADEIGDLARSFNGMAEDLALKERYRSVLDKVADREVAEALVCGDLELGGELRSASVLFCDIRGFTALTEHMPPEEVIGMLNEHMTALTEIVYQHGGVVDKFVGDLIMAIFGVPKSYGDDAANAARCALQMIERRAELNAAGGRPIEMGIGLATGEVVAGCMGSEDRLNYTVLGERVNLAARLCGKADAGEVVIDQETFAVLGDSAATSPRGPYDLKGFTGTVPAFSLTSVNAAESP